MRDIFDMFHDCADDSFTVKTVSGVRDIHVLSRTINILPVIGHCKDIRVFFCKPGWNRVGRSTDDDRDAILCSCIQHFIQMCEIKDAVLWLDRAPGRLCDTDRVHSGFCHHLHVLLYTVIRKIFRVVGRTE